MKEVLLIVGMALIGTQGFIGLMGKELYVLGISISHFFLTSQHFFSRELAQIWFFRPLPGLLALKWMGHKGSLF